MPGLAGPAKNKARDKQLKFSCTNLNNFVYLFSRERIAAGGLQ
jgi:hypothetical protein